jgi:hypothetical protein
VEGFRSLLDVSANSLQGIGVGLRSYLGRLGEDWQDQQCREFTDDFLRAESALVVFAESTEIYGRYLSRLIEQLEEYLRHTLLSQSSRLHAAFGFSDDRHRNLVRRDVQEAVDLLSPAVWPLYSKWPSLSSRERLDHLREIQSKVGAIQGRKPVPVIPESMPPYLFGIYDGSLLKISQEHLDTPDRFWHVVDTLLHEDRHAYQRHAINTLGFHPDSAQVRAWTSNWKHYLDGERVPARVYRSQPVEADAFWFAESVVLGIIRRRHVG